MRPDARDNFHHLERGNSRSRAVAASVFPTESAPPNTSPLAFTDKHRRAVLLDVDGTCHAIGVVLDGRVGVQGTIIGNRGRGARYNSAVRYAADEKCPRCLIIVRSEDGMLNFIPEEETLATAGESVTS